MADRAAKDAMFDGLAQVAKALGNGRRAELVDVLAQGERSVDELAVQIHQSVANTSHHLQVLARAGVVANRRDGTRVHYRLASERVGDLWAALRDVAAHHVSGFDELAHAYLGEHDEIAVVEREDLVRRLKDRDLVILDVRPRAEYEAGHIPGARHIEPTEPEGALSVPADAEVVAYCRGPYCAFALDTIRALRAEGRQARRLRDGFPEWKRDGLPVATVNRPAP